MWHCGKFSKNGCRSRHKVLFSGGWQSGVKSEAAAALAVASACPFPKSKRSYWAPPSRRAALYPRRAKEPSAAAAAAILSVSLS